MLLTMMATTGTMWGQSRTETTTTCTFSTKAWAADNGGTWTSGKDGNQFTSGRGVQVTTGVSGANGTSGDTFENVSKVVVTYSTNASAGAGSIAIKVGSGTAKSQAVTKTGGTTDRTLTYNFSPYETGKVNITVTCTTNSIYVKSVAITTTSGGSTPSITAADVNIAYDATNGSIAYTLNNGTGNVNAALTTGDWLNLGEITASEVPFTCSANNTAAPRTATVTLSFTGATDKVVTITQTGNPNVVNNISDITAAGTYTVKGTVVAKSTRGFILGDGTGYVYYYKGSAVDQNVGDIVKLSGDVTAPSNYKVFQFGNNTEITTATESNYVAEDPTTITGAQMDAVVTGSNVTLSNYVQYVGTLTVNNTYYNITSIDGATTAKGSISYPTNTEFTSLDGKTVTVTGYFVGVSSDQYYNTMIGSIVEVTDPSISIDPATAASFTYMFGNGPSDDQIFTVTGTNLVSADITATVTSDYEITDDQDYSSSVTIASGDMVSVRLKSGLAKGTHNGTLTLSSTDAEDVVVNLSGTVTGQTYTIEQYTLPATAHGTITFSPASPVEDGTEVTLTATPADGYDFTADSWVFYKESGQDYVVDNTIVVTNSKITMPAYNIWVDATFAVKPTYAITKVVTPANGGTVETDETAWEGKTVTVSVTKAAHYDFTSIVVSKTEDPETTIQTSGSYANGFTFTMPAYAVTVTVTFTELQDYATIPFSYDDNGSPNPVPTGMTFYSIGNYDNSPKMKFDATDDYVIIYYHGEANKLGYTIKNNGTFTNSTFDVLESVDGTNYSTVHRYTSLNATLNESYNINPASKYIKFIYTTKGSGNVALGAISIKQLATPTDSWQLNEVPVVAHTVTIGEANTFPTFVTTSDGAKTYTSTDTGVATINETTGEITLMSAGNTTIKCATAETATYLASEKSYTLTVNAGANYTVTYHVNGATSTSEVPAGNLNLTEPQNIPGGYTYVGWTDTEIIGVSSDATYFTSYNVTANVDLYAVFSMERYDKMVSVPTPGTYVIASKIENTYKVFAGQDGNNSYGMAVNVTEITPTNVENYVVTIASTANGYSIKYGNIYLGWTTGNSLDFDTEFTANYNEWTFAMNDGNVDVISKKDNTRKLKWNASSPRFACYTSAQTPVILFKKVLVLCTTVSPAPIPVDGNGEMTGNTTIPSGSAYTITTPVTVPEGITLTVNGTLGNDDPANLVINDGGQVIVNNAGVQATVKKAVGHTAKSTGDWYTISSPVNNIAPGDVTNLIQATATNYDFYYYNEPSGEWFNHKAAGHAVSNMTNGRGYLYWNADGDELAFAGELNTGEVEVAVTAGGSGDLKGINLIGNPYSHNIYKGDGTAIPNAGASLVTGFYVLSNSDSWVACTDNTTAIKPGQGILVKTTTGGTVQMTNTTSKGTAKAGNDNIRFTVANNQYEDVAYALFKNEIGLDKINHRNAEVPMLYIPQDGINYAIATMSDDVEMFTLSFKTVTTSKYTLSVKLDGRYDYLHIIDRLTGEDVDMLVEGEYSFMGTPKDLVDRFIVKLKYDANINDVNDIFAYQSGSDVIVNGEGELQIFDLMGRKVMTQTVNGVQTVNVPAQGVYIFRLNGKVQKIVVK